TQDTTPDTSVPVSEESAGSPTAPTDAPTTSISRNLPSTGQGSGAVIMFAAVMAALGWLLVRTARRRPA
ncbi:MAG: LPXTG cell wall anchor domain-containing protein, partial [Ilumatobacter sp.]|nr:LPXTG cell wall anchor domain-containing protein [Ilumatobacter sp.]